MYKVLNCITTEHDLLHVLGALFVLAFGNACSLIIFHRSHMAVRRQDKFLWALAAGTVVGLGVWSTHFIALLGYKPGFEVAFDGWRTLLSGVIVISGFIVTALITRINASEPMRLVCALIATASVVGMHFYGMTALHASALLEYDRLAITMAIILGFLFYVGTYLIGANPNIRGSTPIATLTSVIAVLAIHFISASGTTMIPIRGLTEPAWVIKTGGVSLFIAIAMAVVVLLSALAVGLDKRFHRMQRKEQDKLLVLADASSEGLFVVSTDGRILQTNLSAKILFCDRLSEIANLQDMGRAGQPGSLPGLEGRMMQEILQIDESEFTLRENRDYGERRIRFADGREMIATVTGRCIEDTHEDFIVFGVHDITQRTRAEARARSLAYRDTLTGLPNRAAFNMALESSVKDTSPDRKNLAVMIIDLDNFKEVNDQYGHGAGDTLLKSIGRRISGQLSRHDMAARLGGDEFAVLLRDCETQEEVAEVAERLLAAISEPVSMGRRILTSGGSIGVALAPPRATNPARILTFADHALYSAKAAGRNCVRFYDAALHKEQSDKRELERALHAALEQNEFVLHFQPKVSATTRTIVGREALIRWNRGETGLIGPDLFIPLAEQSMLIVEIGRWTIHAACKAASQWPNGESVAVNLSARQLMDPDLLYHVRSALEETRLDPSRLELEITETAIIHNTQLATNILLDLKALGIKISLDDFGTGYSSMSYIQEFPFDRIKIDRSFVMSMIVDSKSRAIVEAIIHLAHSLQIPVVAEGVETEDQADALARLSCEELQGFLIAAPGPSEESAREEDVDEEDAFLFGAQSA